MEAIANHLQDPGWWFTAVIIGIVASVLAGFTKDYLEKRVGNVLTRSKTKREKARVARQKAIDAWSQNESLVLITLVRMVSMLLLAVCTIIMSVQFLLFLMALKEAGQSVSVFNGLLLLSLLGGCFYACAVASSDISIGGDCLQAFRRSRGLPRL